MCVCVRVFGGAPWHIVTPATGVRSAGARWCDLMLSGNLAYQCHNGSFHFNLCECVRACAERRNDSLSKAWYVRVVFKLPEPPVLSQIL